MYPQLDLAQSAALMYRCWKLKVDFQNVHFSASFAWALNFGQLEESGKSTHAADEEAIPRNDVATITYSAANTFDIVVLATGSLRTIAVNFTAISPL